MERFKEDLYHCQCTFCDNFLTIPNTRVRIIGEYWEVHHEAKERGWEFSITKIACNECVGYLNRDEK